MASIESVRRAKCGCCGIWEDCTLDYIGCVKERYGGTWVCGLCQEAIKEEQARLGIDVDAALRAHATFIETANVDPTVGAVRSIVGLLKKIISSSTSHGHHPK